MSADTQKLDDATAFSFPIARPETGDLAKKIELSFDRMGYRSLREVQCVTDSGRITLQGNTPTYYLKQVAQVIAAKIAGVGVINNQIKVIN